MFKLKEVEDLLHQKFLGGYKTVEFSSEYYSFYSEFSFNVHIPGTVDDAIRVYMFPGMDTDGDIGWYFHILFVLNGVEFKRMKFKSFVAFADNRKIFDTSESLAKELISYVYHLFTVYDTLIRNRILRR